MKKPAEFDIEAVLNDPAIPPDMKVAMMFLAGLERAAGDLMPGSVSFAAFAWMPDPGGRGWHFHYVGTVPDTEAFDMLSMAVAKRA